MTSYSNLFTNLIVRIPTLTHEVLHHGRIMMRRRSQAQQLLATRHCGVVDSLDVDVVSFQQGVTHLVVQLSIAHLEIETVKGNIQGVAVNPNRNCQSCFLAV